MSAEVTTDFSEIDKIFDNLNSKQLKQVLNPAIRKTLNPIIATAKSNFSLTFKTRTGKALKSLGVSPYRRTIGLGAGARIKGQFVGYYARFLDGSTKERFRTTKSGKRASTGKITASNFFTNAVKSNEASVESNLEQNVINQINKMISNGKI